MPSDEDVHLLPGDGRVSAGTASTPMELSLFTDYSLRTLMFSGLHAGTNVTVAEVAMAYGISNHLVKIIHHLGKLGFLETKRGRSGGFQLSRPAGEINLGK